MDGILSNIKGKFNEYKNKITLTEIEQKLEEATSNEHCHANVSLLDEIADKAGNYSDYQTIINHIEKTLQVDKTKWRRLLKTLFLVEHLLRVGNNRFVSSLNGFLYMIKSLTTFRYTDEKKEEKGGSIREKASFIVEMCEDSEKLEEERQKYKGWKNRIAGVSNSGNTGGGNSTSVSSSNYKNTGNNAFGGVSSSNIQDKNKVNTNYNPSSFKKTEIKSKNIDSDSDEEKDNKKGKSKTKEQADSDDEPPKNKRYQKEEVKEIKEIKQVKEIKPKINLKGFKKEDEDDIEFEEVKENLKQIENKNKNEIDFFPTTQTNYQSQPKKVENNIDFFTQFADTSSKPNTNNSKINEIDFSTIKNDNNNQKKELIDLDCKYI